MRRLKPRDLPGFVPKLYGVAVYKLLGPFFGVIVVFAEQVYAGLNVTVRPDHVRPVPVHGGSTLAAEVRGS